MDLIPYKDNILAAVKDLNLIYVMRDCYPPKKGYSPMSPLQNKEKHRDIVSFFGN